MADSFEEKLASASFLPFPLEHKKLMRMFRIMIMLMILMILMSLVGTKLITPNETQSCWPVNGKETSAISSCLELKLVASGKYCKVRHNLTYHNSK